MMVTANFMNLLTFSCVLILNGCFRNGCDGMPLSRPAPSCLLSADEQVEQDAMVYLEQYGYLPQQLYQPGAGGNRGDITDALIKFQQMSGIPQTGILDSTTQQEIKKPRCGVPDIGEYGTTKAKWDYSSLRYRIDTFTGDLSRTVVQQEIRRAWQVWADVTPLTFMEVGADEEADFVILFGSGDHGDNYPFDGSGGVLAHAFFPRNGRVHFDDAERWTVESYSGFNLFVVAVHEFGHALGLKHSSVQGAIMKGSYPGYKGNNFKLGADDIEGIQSLYGAPGSGRDDSGSEPPTAACGGEFATVFKTADGILYGFTDGYVWDLTNRLTNDVSTVAGNTSIFHSALEETTAGPQAAVTVDGKTYIFSGCQAWRFNNRQFEGNESISDLWHGLPCNFDAVFKADDGFTYFFFNLALNLGQYVYKFQGFHLRWQGFASSLGWNGFPTDLTTIDAIIASGNRNNDVYIFSNRRYWKLNQKSKTFYHGYPRDTVTNWLSNCPLDL